MCQHCEFTQNFPRSFGSAIGNDRDDRDTRLGFMSAAQLVRKFSSSAVAPRRKMGPFSNGWPTMVA